MADSNLPIGALRSVQIEALVVMKMVKHCSQSFPTIATGSLVGMDVNGTLQVTNSFPFPTIDPSTTDAREESIQNMAAAAPRAKANAAYQNDMIRFLREVNVDANNVGWYTSTSMGNFLNANTIENQFYYQKEMNERTVALVYDVSRSVQGSLSLRAFRLSPLFMTAFKENKFATESLQKSGLRYQDILVELPVKIHNSHLLTTFLHELPAPPATQLPGSQPNSLSTLLSQSSPAGQSTSSASARLPLSTNFDTLDLSIDPYLEKTCDLLLDSIEAHHTEINNAQYYQRSLAREQAKISAWQAKRKAENAARAAAKQPALPEDEWQKLFKLPVEPSRLDILLHSAQVDQYAGQVDGFVGTVSGKMFAVKNNIIRED